MRWRRPYRAEESAKRTQARSVFDDAGLGGGRLPSEPRVNLGFFQALGLFGLYLLWLGLSPLMKSPDDKSIAYAGAMMLSWDKLPSMLIIAASPQIPKCNCSDTYCLISPICKRPHKVQHGRPRC
jgi:hypothetical protein